MSQNLNKRFFADFLTVLTQRIDPIDDKKERASEVVDWSINTCHFYEDDQHDTPEQMFFVATLDQVCDTYGHV